MFKRIRSSSRSIIVTWLVSYLSVLLVPIIISGIIYAASLQIVKTEINRANESVLLQMEQAIDNKLRGIERLSMEIALNRQVTNFIHTELPLKDTDHFELYGISKELRVYRLANDFIDQIYIYYKNSDTVISPDERLNGKKLYTHVRKGNNETFEEWNGYFDQRYIQAYSPVIYESDNKSVKSVMFTRSVDLHNPGEPGDVVLFIIKDSKLLEHVVPAEGSTVMILDGEDRLVASTGAAVIPNFLQYDRLTEPRGLFYDDASEEKVAVSYTTSDVTNWKYVILTPAAVFDQKMQDMKRLIAISVILCFIVGGVVTFFFLRKNYSPINLLVDSFSKKRGVSFDGGSNEYLFLQEAINSTFMEKEEITMRLRRHNNVIRAHFLIGLLKGRPESNVPIHESLAAHDIRFESPEFAVLLFHIDDHGKFSSAEDDKTGDPSKIKLLHFFLLNVVEEISRENNEAYTVEMDDWLACIINFKPELEEKERELMRITDDAKTFLHQHLQISMTVAASGIHKELFGISEAYQQALEALEYGIVMGTGETIRYDELKSNELTGTPSSYYYPLNIEQQLINFMKTGNIDKSREIIELVFTKNFEDASLPVSMAKCLMFDLIGTMMKTMEDINAAVRSNFMEQADSIDSLMNCRTVKEMKGQLIKVLQQVCNLIETGRKQDKQLAVQVTEYVSEHYSNEALNISMIGEHFGLTPSYLSKQYREQTGEALLETINRTRLREAKLLLSNQKMTVNEIARSVGYGDINTFHRIFKKFEGITPGKYKDMM
ncbi:MAG: helix-turn-helix domain-containing protein [Candidatus Pristimantibacillus sp.]